MMRMKQDFIMMMKVIVRKNSGLERMGTNLDYENVMGIIYFSNTHG